MKKLTLLFSLFLAFAFCSCEDEESQLKFDYTSSALPGCLKVEYYSPDPGCVSKMYYITANRRGGKVSMRCENVWNLYFAPLTSNTGLTYGCTPFGDVDTNTLVSEDGAWTVSIDNGGYVKFEFYETPEYSGEDFPLVMADVTVCAMDKNKELRTWFCVQRILTDTPL